MKPKRKRKRAHKRAPKRKPKPSKRSEAARKGWEKRRKKQRLIKAMHDAKWKHADKAQPRGWTERRAELREIHGEIWREIAVEYSDVAYRAEHLAALAELEIDMLTKDELQDYLEWIGDEYEMDISDLYQLYLGYRPNEEGM